ncbi:hypothetical protein PoB_006309000 [Plakobranchus ocellatus]|uniref:Uncharacterized protein n=1 Tax=Plakobranchus ocellatus TaxID=259542 RepID=A0AAV4CXR7_9GAST|nr:hypothetical protein PoB_006309000 [Plakobranchus ocellatus]
MQKDKEVGRKEGGGWGRLTEPDHSRRTGIVINRHRGNNLCTRANATCPRTAIKQKIKEVGRKEGGAGEGSLSLTARDGQVSLPIVTTELICVYARKRTLASVSRENVVRETSSTCARKFPSPTKQKLFKSRLLVSADGRANQRRRASTSLMLRSLSTVPHKYHGFSKRENVYKIVGSIQTREPQAETATSHCGFLLLSPSPTLTPVPTAVESRPSPGYEPLAS